MSIKYIVRYLDVKVFSLLLVSYNLVHLYTFFPKRLV